MNRREQSARGAGAAVRLLPSRTLVHGGQTCLSCAKSGRVHVEVAAFRVDLTVFLTRPACGPATVSLGTLLRRPGRVNRAELGQSKHVGALWRRCGSEREGASTCPFWPAIRREGGPIPRAPLDAVCPDTPPLSSSSCAAAPQPFPLWAVS